MNDQNNQNPIGTSPNGGMPTPTDPAASLNSTPVVDPTMAAPVAPVSAPVEPVMPVAPVMPVSSEPAAPVATEPVEIPQGVPGAPTGTQTA